MAYAIQRPTERMWSSMWVWRKSTRSLPTGDCVEVGVNVHTPGVVGYRDSKRPSGGMLVFCAADHQKFVSAIQNGRIAT